MSNSVYSKPTLWKRIVRGTIDVFAAVFLVCALLCTFFSHIVFNENVYKKIILTDAFDESIENNIYESLNSIYTIIDIPSDKIISSVGMEPFIAYEHNYTDGFLDSIIRGTSFEMDDFYDEKIVDLIREELSSMEGVTVSEEDFNSICECVFSKLNASLQYIPKLVIDKISDISTIIHKISFVSELELPLYLGFILAVLGNFFFGGTSHFRDVFFGLSSSCWIATVTIAIPLVLINNYDFPSHLALETSTLKWLIAGLFDLVFNCLSFMFVVVAIVLTILLAAACYVKVKYVKKEEKKHFFHANFDDDAKDNQETELNS